MKKRVFVYLRTSTINDTDSLRNQETLLQEYCEANDLEAVGIFADEGCSGIDMDRPELQNMIEAIKNNEADIVLVSNIDRLTRSERDLLHLIKNVFAPNDVGFIALKDGLDTSTLEGRAKVAVLEAEYKSTVEFMKIAARLREEHEEEFEETDELM